MIELADQSEAVRQMGRDDRKKGLPREAGAEFWVAGSLALKHWREGWDEGNMIYHKDNQLTIYKGDALSVLRGMESESVQVCVTSPPYYGLRDYGVDGQIGMEETPELFIAKLVDVFREVRRVLKDDGTCWINIGDSYWGGKGQSGSRGMEFQQMRVEAGVSFSSPAAHVGGNGKTRPTDKKHESIKAKDLIGIPWMLAFALRADGWYLRQDIIWAKPNPMPESVTDRCTKSHEYIFLLSKRSRYFYDADAIKEPIKDTSIARLIQNVEEQQVSDRVPGKTNGTMKAVKFGGNNLCPDTRLQSGKEWNPKMAGGGSKVNGHSGYFDKDGNPLCGVMANKKSVWSVTTRGYKDAHFATFPPALIEPCILAGSRIGDTVIDPFGGSGTSAEVANKFGRKAVLIELNPDYCELAMKRNCQKTLFAGVEA